MEHNGREKPVVLSESDSDQILDLINLIQPDIPWSREHLRWQYFESPAGRARLYGIKDSQNKLIAFYAAVAQRIRIGRQLMDARMVQDVMTHPDYRGRGFLHQLAEQCLQDVIQSGEIAYTFPNEKSEKSFRRVGWTELCSVPWRKKTIYLEQPIPALEMTEITGCLNASTVSSIWESSGLGIGVNRDIGYLNWRYSKPATKYFKFLVNDSEGLVVLKIYGDTLHVCDLFTRSDSLKNVSQILKFCDGFAAQHGANVLTAWLPDDHLYSFAFNHHGLKLITGVTRYIFVHLGKNTAQGLADPRLWHITQGDSDIY